MKRESKNNIRPSIANAVEVYVIGIEHRRRT